MTAPDWFSSVPAVLVDVQSTVIRKTPVRSSPTAADWVSPKLFV